MDRFKKVQPTQRQQDKAKEQAKFDKEEIKDFITEKNRLSFGHICGRCGNKRYCYKWKGAIVINCDKFNQK